MGYPVNIDSGVATLVQRAQDDTPLLQIQLRALSPAYEAGDHIKIRWGDSTGMVISVDEVRKTLTYIESDTYNKGSTTQCTQ